MCHLLILAGSVVALTAGAVHADPPEIASPEVARVVVEKSARRLAVFDETGRAVLVINGVQLGSQPLGPKRFEGDGRTPEGHYVIDRGLEDSAYHLALHISYPDSNDRARAAAQGRSAGGAIFIHGQPNSLQNGRIAGDWTAGCVAVSNAEIEQLWTLVPDGTPIDLLP